jgi:hypothetical protein
MFTPREVLVPLVGPGGVGALCRVAADDHLPPPHPAQLDRSISDLLECGLYQAGQQARAAVRRLRLQKGLLTKPAPFALSVVNPGDIAGLAPDNSSSAELGLALAALMFISQSPVATVIATGAMAVNDSSPDVLVRPIHYLGAKFAVVQRYFGQAGAPRPPAFFFIPQADVDGVPTLDRYGENISALKALGIEVVPAGSLRSAAASIAALQLARRPLEIWARRGAIAASLLALLGAGSAWLVNRPIRLDFLPFALDDGRIAQTPVRLRTGEDGRAHALRPCPGFQGTPEYPVKDALVAEVRSGRPDDSLSSVVRNYHVLVSISSDTGIKILPLPWDGVRAGETIGYRLDLVPAHDEDNLLVLLARRFWPFDAAELESELHRRIDSLKKSEQLSAARNFLTGAAPGYLEYLFRTVNDRETCP